MSEVVRLYRYKSLLSDRRAVSAKDLMATLEISRATFKRDMAKRIDETVGAGYGIFGGTPTKAWATLKFSPERELMGDLLRFGVDVEVLAPPDLRSRIKRALHEAAGKYV